jgi:hypothetical protein
MFYTGGKVFSALRSKRCFLIEPLRVSDLLNGLASACGRAVSGTHLGGESLCRSLALSVCEQAAPASHP